MTMKLFNHTLLALALLTATAASAQTVEYFWDSDPGVGHGTVLQTFEGDIATVTTTLDAAALSAGVHTLGLRVLNGAWFSQTYHRQFYVPPQEEQITRIEYGWDEAPALGSGTALTFTAGNVVNLSEQLSTEGLSAGIHDLYVQVLSTGHHSNCYKRQFFIPPVEETIERIEYGWDVAPAFGQGTAIEFKAGNTVDLTTALNTESLTAGIHTLYLQAQSTNYRSQVYSRTFYVPATPHVVQAVEYFFDEDPGMGNGIRMAAATKNDSLTTSFEIPTEELADGVHHIGLRTLTDGTWSSTITRQFLVRHAKEDDITRVEYFWDTDPGAGNGYVVDITPGKEVTVEFNADMYGLDAGIHTLGVRAQSGSKGWSKVSTQEVDFEGWDALQDYLNSLRDTQDQLSANGYTREFLNKEWQSLYVPFTMNYEQWADHFDVARINGFYQYDDDGDGVVDRQVLEAIIVRPGNGSLRANYPYLIRAKTTDTYLFDIDPQQVVAEETNSYSCSTMEAQYTFTGNYTQLTGMKTAGYYRLRGGAISLPTSDDEVLPPYRWYLTIEDRGNQLIDNPAAIRIRIVGDGEATDIFGMPIADIQPDSDGTVYDLQGRHVSESGIRNSELRKGLYIVNGKKVVK